MAPQKTIITDNYWRLEDAENLSIASLMPEDVELIGALRKNFATDAIKILCFPGEDGKLHITKVKVAGLLDSIKAQKFSGLPVVQSNYSGNDLKSLKMGLGVILKETPAPNGARVL